MNPPRATRPRWLPRIRLFHIACLLLAAWAAGLAVAAWELGAWQRELTRTLLQLNSDAQFRALAPHRDAVAPEWYRRKGLALLAATERLHRDTSWTLFIPGSWRRFDDLEERVQARLDREFGDIVVETIRHELLARASHLTGVPRAPGRAGLQAHTECKVPATPPAPQQPTGAVEQLPEFIAMEQYVRGVAQLDEAVQAFLSLQFEHGRPEQLRKLVAYALGAELPGGLEHSVRFFHLGEQASLQPALLRNQLQWATRCTLSKGMAALHGRLLNANELLALEQGLAKGSQGLFEVAARPLPFDRALERYRAVHALLEDQHLLLARGGNAWMRQDRLHLGPAWQRMLEQIETTSLLGPQAVQELHSRSGAAFAAFRRQFESAFGRPGQPGIVWLQQEGRFALSAERAALREALGGLLKMPFMAESEPRGRALPSMAAVTKAAQSLMKARDQFRKQQLPAFPPSARPAVARLVDHRVAELIYEQAYRTLKTALPADLYTPLDPAVFRKQRKEVAALQHFLKSAGSPKLGERLGTVLDDELLRRLELIDEDWQRQPLLQRSGLDFGSWHGEPLVAAHAIGASSPFAVPSAVGNAAHRLDLLARQAGTLLDLGGPALAATAEARRWQLLVREAERYRARRPESSLLRLERYLTGLGSDLRVDNCGRRLGEWMPQAVNEDDVARRHVEIHNALARRCNELRAQVMQ